jgi:SAM-dependent methyltransferase
MALAEGAGESGQAQVNRAFTEKWYRMPDWGMAGPCADLLRDAIFARYGWHTQHGYDRYMSQHRKVLDVGCGVGRETLRMAKSSPGTLVIGLDASEAVHAAQEHAHRQGLSNVRIVKADLAALPFPSGGFDFVLAEGVLHHTPSTRDALRSVARMVSPGGELGLYVYRTKGVLREFADDHSRELIRNGAPRDTWSQIETITEIGRRLHELGVSIEVPADVPMLGLERGRFTIQELVYYFAFKCFWNPALTFEENAIVNFDWYAPSYAWRQSESEVRSWLEDLDFEIAHEHVQRSGITVRARRRAAHG